MIQFNLLPDVKIQYLKARRDKRRVFIIATFTIIVSFAILITLYSVRTLQNRHISAQNKDIASNVSTLQKTTDLAKILTIQNQLNSLPGLYANRPVTSRLFGYVQNTTPKEISISHLNLSFIASTLTVDGKTDSLESVNRYVDTLKFTKFTVKDVTGDTPVFSNVVLATFSRDQTQATFNITTTFNPDIFNASKIITLEVPKTITTRSETELPGNNVFDTKATN